VTANLLQKEKEKEHISVSQPLAGRAGTSQVMNNRWLTEQEPLM
jgi:hypothetical protein